MRQRSTRRLLMYSSFPPCIKAVYLLLLIGISMAAVRMHRADLQLQGV